MPDLIHGWVTRFQSGFYTVLTADGPVTCHLRGRLKRRTVQGDIIAIGSRVQISLQPDGTGMVEVIEPHTNALVRLDPTPRGDYRQILLANPDQVLLVFACTQPDPNRRMLDRFLVICEKNEIPPVVVFNKIDLVGLETARQRFGVYERLGYRLLFTSVKQAVGLEELREVLKDKVSGLAGPSGVGKSSLLNAIQPKLGLAVREVSSYNAKGRHTTVVREMFRLEVGGFVADLPGLRSLVLWDTEPEELDGYFPELRDRVADCQYNDCTHQNEPGCAIRHAVATGEVDAERYQSYLRLRFGRED
jgi:ribosome biogenesis GTPase / thiamine phosphate phosphatase